MRQPVRIWGPRASRLDVIVGGERSAAVREGGGWWRGPALAHGDRYAVSVDGGDPVPDPRSRSQPEGVHGASRWIDVPTPSRDGFRQVALRDAVIYETHVGTFSAEGTFAGMIPHLDHLRELGVTHVELMPVAQFSGTHGWGYDGVDLFAPHAGYGEPADLRAVIRACHDRGLAVLIDVVHNHFGPEGAYATTLGPYVTDRHRTPWGGAINLDGDGASEVRRYLIDSALGWLRDYGADGLRLDAVHALHDESPRHFIAELADAVAALGVELDRRLVLIGEYDEHDPICVTERARGGWGLDAHWNDDFHHAVHTMLTSERAGYYGDFANPDALAKVLTGGYALDGGYSAFRKTHHGKPFGMMPRDRLVAYVQSHDQIGNRALGDRLHQLCGLERAKLAAAMLLVSPFVPMLFQGEEWAASTPFCYFAYPDSTELRAAIRRGRAEEHAAGWGAAPRDPTDEATREACVLRWDERTSATHAEMLAWYRDLIALRKELPELRDPEPGTTSVGTEDGCLHIDRGRYRLIANLTDRERACRGRVVLASARAGTRLPPSACAIIERSAA